jgi:peptide deformylase
MIITNNEELLRVKCEEVLPEEIEVLIEVLEKELAYANRLGKGGIGLAAPQIGIAKKAAIVRIADIKMNLINAKIEQGYDLTLFKEEGCLSFPNHVEDTMRFQEVFITNNLVEPHQFTTTGLLAVVCQHELDHLNSTLFMDHKIEKTKPVVSKQKQRPNELCSCGSGKKHKRCCK